MGGSKVSERKESAQAPQPGPAHYQGDGLVTAQRALASCASQEVTCHRPELGFYWWAIAFKYVWRLWSKGHPASDCSKAIDCLERLRGEMGWTDD